MDSSRAIIEEQKLMCALYKAEYCAVPAHSRVGIAKNVNQMSRPINGLRHPPSGETSGWYIWAGTELSSAPDFFLPSHAERLQDRCPDVLKFLGLPPGWRFLIAGDYRDVWFDADLLNLPELS